MQASLCPPARHHSASAGLHPMVVCLRVQQVHHVPPHRRRAQGLVPSLFPFTSIHVLLPLPLEPLYCVAAAVPLALPAPPLRLPFQHRAQPAVLGARCRSQPPLPTHPSLKHRHIASAATAATTAAGMRDVASACTAATAAVARGGGGVREGAAEQAGACTGLEG
eukprot:1157541-Pelagomonas_calceolata.AAC.9